jgi:hypothetical protein
VVAHPVEEMYALYERGATLKEVAEQFGIPGLRLGQIFRDAGLKIRSPGRRVVAHPVEEMYALYEQGASLQEVGDGFGISGQRLGEIFGDAGLKTRSLAESAMVKAVLGRERAEEVVESFYRLKDVRLVALELEIARGTVRSVLGERLSQGEYRTIARKPAKKTYSDEELLGFLREASAGRENALSAVSYDAFGRDRRTADGRPWPTQQTHCGRFGSWRNALLKAGVRLLLASGR